jgi:uncharacterized protein (TIGR00730 family)
VQNFRTKLDICRKDNFNPPVMKSVAVFCGANPGNRAIYADQTILLGQTLAGAGISVVFGGGSVGLMGVLADAVIAAGGKLTGVITEQLHSLELGHPGLQEMIIVESMAERRTLLIKGTDGVITLPGGYGTMDEHFEALTLAQLHQFRKPIGLLNVEGYYDPMIEMLDKMVDCGFLKAQNRNLCVIANNVPELLERMQAYEFQALSKWH